MTDDKTLCTTHEPGACHEGCPDAYSHDADLELHGELIDDERYGADRLRSYTRAQLEQHLTHRGEQRERARRELDIVEAQIAGLTDWQIEETREGKDALKTARALAREIRTQTAIVGLLEDEQKRATIRRDLEQPAGMTITTAGMDWIQAQLEDDGLLGFDLGEDETSRTTATMWEHAVLALEAHTDETPTQRQVADRVIGAWLTLYAYPEDDTPAAADEAPGHGPAGEPEPGLEEIRINQAVIDAQGDFVDAAVHAALSATGKGGQRRWGPNADVIKMTEVGPEHVEITVAEDKDADDLQEDVQVYRVTKSDIELRLQ